jgi:hypothetical protein
MSPQQVESDGVGASRNAYCHAGDPEAGAEGVRHLHYRDGVVGIGEMIIQERVRFKGLLQVSGTVLTYVLVALQFHALWSRK